ncbi:MAG: glycosyltransferase family 4 protein [Bacteriovoracaceae bacterium]
MNILLVSDDMLLGGAARHIVDVANALSGEGTQVTVAATDGVMRRQLSSKVEFVELFMKDNHTTKNSYTGFFPSYRKLAAAVSGEKFDIIHSHKRYSHLLAALVARRYRIPHITTYHTLFTGKKLFSFFGDHTICCSESIRKSLVGDFSRRGDCTITIHNGIHPLRTFNAEERQTAKAALAIPETNVVIGSIGQFVPEKDRLTLLQSIHELNNRSLLEGVTVLIQGYGPQEQMLRTLCSDLRLDLFVRFIGGDEPVERTCNISDFMILNSVIEGFPLILLEAASVGVPHIASNISGIPKFIDHGVTGLLIEPRNSVQLTEAIIAFRNDPELRRTLGKNAQRKYEQQFTFPVMLERMKEVYSQVRGKQN